MSGIRIGQVTHFYDKIKVAVIITTATIQVGDMVHFLGHSTDFKQEVTSLQIEHQGVNEVGSGQEVAMKVSQTVHPKDTVYKLTKEE